MFGAVWCILTATTVIMKNKHTCSHSAYNGTALLLVTREWFMWFMLWFGKFTFLSLCLSLRLFFLVWMSSEIRLHIYHDNYIRLAGWYEIKIDFCIWWLTVSFEMESCWYQWWMTSTRIYKYVLLRRVFIWNCNCRMRAYSIWVNWFIAIVVQKIRISWIRPFVMKLNGFLLLSPVQSHHTSIIWKIGIILEI